MQHNTFLLKPIFKAIIYTGLLVGTLDILSALTDYYIDTGKNPLIIFKFIASGILGEPAFSGGNGIILLGLLLHYFIALSFTALFFCIYTKIMFLSKYKIITGILYGIFIGVIMNFVIVPMSLAPKMSFELFKVIKAFLILIVMIGIPLSFLTNHFFMLNMKNHI